MSEGQGEGARAQPPASAPLQAAGAEPVRCLDAAGQQGARLVPRGPAATEASLEEWTPFPASLWLFPDLLEHRMQF